MAHKIRKVRNKNLYWIVDHTGKKLITHAVSLSQLKGGDFTWEEVLGSEIKQQFTNPDSTLRKYVIPALEAAVMIALLLVPGVGEAVDGAILAAEAGEAAEVGLLAAEGLGEAATIGAEAAAAATTAAEAGAAVAAETTSFLATLTAYGTTAAELGQTAYTAYQLAEVVQNGGSPLEVTIATLGLAVRVAGLPGLSSALKGTGITAETLTMVATNLGRAKTALEQIDAFPGNVNKFQQILMDRYPAGLPTNTDAKLRAILEAMLDTDNENGWLFGGFSELRDPDGGPADFILRYGTYVPNAIDEGKNFYSTPSLYDCGDRSLPTATPTPPSGNLGWKSPSYYKKKIGPFVNSGAEKFDPTWVNSYGSASTELNKYYLGLTKSYDLKKVILDIFNSYPKIEAPNLEQNIEIAYKNMISGNKSVSSAPSTYSQPEQPLINPLEQQLKDANVTAGDLENARNILKLSPAQQAATLPYYTQPNQLRALELARKLDTLSGGVDASLDLKNTNPNAGGLLELKIVAVPLPYTKSSFVDGKNNVWNLGANSAVSGPIFKYGVPYITLNSELIPHLTPYNVYYPVYPNDVTLINKITSTESDPEHDLGIKILTIGSLWSPSGGNLQDAIDMNGILAYWFMTQAGTYVDLSLDALDYLYSTEQITNSTAIVNIATVIWSLNQQLGVQQKIAANAFTNDKLLSTPLTLDQAGVIATGKTKSFYEATIANRNDKMRIYQQLDLDSHANVNSLISQISTELGKFKTAVATFQKGWMDYMTTKYNGYVINLKLASGSLDIGTIRFPGVSGFADPNTYILDNPIPLSKDPDAWTKFVTNAKKNINDKYGSSITLKYPNGPVDYYAATKLPYPVKELGQYSVEAFVEWLSNEVFYSNSRYSQLAPSPNTSAILVPYIQSIIGTNSTIGALFIKQVEAAAFQNYVKYNPTFPPVRFIGYVNQPGVNDLSNEIINQWLAYYRNYINKVHLGQETVNPDTDPSVPDIPFIPPYITGQSGIRMADGTIQPFHFEEPPDTSMNDQFELVDEPPLTGGFMSRRNKGTPAYMLIQHRMRHRV